ncbi:MAG: hypothetical protein ACYC6M_13210, partial [Terriglobales bacterium]
MFKAVGVPNSELLKLKQLHRTCLDVIADFLPVPAKSFPVNRTSRGFWGAATMNRWVTVST